MPVPVPLDSLYSNTSDIDSTIARLRIATWPASHGRGVATWQQLYVARTALNMCTEQQNGVLQ